MVATGCDPDIDQVVYQVSPCQLHKKKYRLSFSIHESDAQELYTNDIFYPLETIEFFNICRSVSTITQQKKGNSTHLVYLKTTYEK